ncbi:MAG: transketolase family protein [Candidatus Micrarchaeia archaeon]
MAAKTQSEFKENKAPREATGNTLAELGKENNEIIVLDADVSSSTKSSLFAKQFPNRFFNMGVSEQDLMGTAAGLALAGKIPFACTFAMFGIGRAWEQIRNTICRDNLNVKILLTHAGITVGEDGSSHQALEDLAIARAIPRLTIICPSDATSASKAVKEAIKHKGPVYLRLGRSAIPTIYEEQDQFKIGKANTLKEGKDAYIIACGTMVAEAIKAADSIEKKGKNVGVIDMHTVKPIDKNAIEKAAQTGAIITAEEGTIIGGLGSAVAEVLSEKTNAKLSRIGTKDTFGESGKPAELLKKYGLTAHNIEQETLTLIEKKEENTK